MRTTLSASWLLLSFCTAPAVAQWQGGPPPPPPPPPNLGAANPGNGGKIVIPPNSGGGSGPSLRGGRRNAGGNSGRPRFEGPGDITPPQSPKPPVADRPSAETPTAAPITPPATPGCPLGQPASRVSARGGLDLTPPPDAWDQWWAANRERFLAVRSWIENQPVTPTTPEGDAAGEARGLSAGLRAAAGEQALAVLEGKVDASRTEIEAALICAGKLGYAPARARQAMQQHLREGAQTTRELAALSLGLLGDAGALPLLLALAQDAPLAHAVSGQSSVDARTRSFAIYGLGLLARRPELAETAPKLARETLLGVLRLRGASGDMEVRTACLSALGVLPLGEHERWTHVYPALEELLGGEDGDFVRAHVLTSAARLSGSSWSERMSLVAQDREEHPAVRGSALLALGRDANELSPALRARAVLALEQAREHGAAFSERGFATLSLGQLGDDEKIGELQRELEARVHLDEPWLALSLGLAARGEIEQGRDVTPRVKALRAAFRATRSPETRGAVAIALGLAQARDAAAELRAAFEEERLSRTRGYLALALGMIGDRTAIPAIRSTLAKGGQEPEDVDALATSLGLLGDADAVPLLLAQMRESKSISELGGLAAGLGRIGDARTVEGLLALARDAKAGSAARTYALSALGMLFESGPLPWNAIYAEDMNYFATTATLSGGSGVLDLL
ncbi:MAG: hypothetical protein IPN34_05710 [Planctomycetes bacterium]|nr:hypothetical protein [Planctomycetota bacterium]